MKIEWKLKDAKPGDVIQSGQITLLFKKFEESEWNFVIAYAGIDISGNLQITDGHWLINNNARLATKEESNKLFCLLAKQGYYWDKDTCSLHYEARPRCKNCIHLREGAVSNVSSVLWCDIPNGNRKASREVGGCDNYKSKKNNNENRN